MAKFYLLIRGISMNSIGPVSYVVVGIITTVTAQILLKTGSSCKFFSLEWFFYLFISVFSYFIAFLCYYMALRYFDISKVSPIMAASTVLLVVLYGFVVGENVNQTKLLGILLAIISVFLLSKS